MYMAIGLMFGFGFFVWQRKNIVSYLSEEFVTEDKNETAFLIGIASFIYVATFMLGWPILAVMIPVVIYLLKAIEEKLK